jgi:RNA polymerase Rpb6
MLGESTTRIKLKNFTTCIFSKLCCYAAQCNAILQRPHTNYCHMFSYDYDGGEPEYDDNEPEDFLEPDDVDVEGEETVGAGEDTYHGAVNGERTIISGDPNAGGGRGVMEQPREKKIPNDQRTTTPYMTKYERARVLGTRALQIRYVIIVYSRFCLCFVKTGI